MGGQGTSASELAPVHSTHVHACTPVATQVTPQDFIRTPGASEAIQLPPGRSLALH